MALLALERRGNRGGSAALGITATRLGAAFADWLDRRRTYRELARLDDRMLKDVGLSRYDVQMIRSSGWVQD